MTRAERIARAPLVEPLSFEVELPSLPPSVNHAYTNRKQGGRVLTADAIAWMKGAVMAIEAGMNEQGWSVPHNRQFIALDIWFYDPLVLGWDLDNRAKVLLDTLKAAIGVDDRYITDAFLRKRRGETRVVLTVTKVMFGD